MSAFISHSFENKPEFENVTDALDLRAVPYWNPAEIKPGASLRRVDFQRIFLYAHVT